MDSYRRGSTFLGTYNARKSIINVSITLFILHINQIVEIHITDDDKNKFHGHYTLGLSCPLPYDGQTLSIFYLYICLYIIFISKPPT